MNDKSCRNCRNYFKNFDDEPCIDCFDKPGFIKWEPNEAIQIKKQTTQDKGTGIQMKGVETMKEKNCITCRYWELPLGASPCRECLMLGDDYEKYWEPKEAENEEKKEEKGKEEIKLKKRPALLAIPVPIYERTESEIPEKVRISFTNGTSAIYMLHVDQPKPLVMESIRIIRKWRSEGYQYVPPRRRRSRK